jgi:hypothetical protein
MSVNRIAYWFNQPRKGADSSDLIVKRNPSPIETRVARIKVGSRWITSIFRAFLYDDVKECRLCPKGSCCAKGGSCLIQVTEYVSDQAAPLYQIPSARRPNT